MEINSEVGSIREYLVFFYTDGLKYAPKYASLYKAGERMAKYYLIAVPEVEINCYHT